MRQEGKVSWEVKRPFSYNNFVKKLILIDKGKYLYFRSVKKFTNFLTELDSNVSEFCTVVYVSL